MKFSLSTQLSQHNLIPWSSWLPCVFLAISCTIDIILPDNTNVFQIWVTGELSHSETEIFMKFIPQRPFSWDKGKWNLIV